ncbi:MAG: hypothetical protein QXL15_02620 [Candidatus Korarchaeota archaeon]
MNIKNVLLDTSFILEALRSRYEILEEIRFLLGPVRFVVIPYVLLELENIASSELDHISKSILSRCEVVEWREGTDADDSLERFAKKHPNTYVATLDRKLCARLRREMIPTIRLKNGRLIIL